MLATVNVCACTKLPTPDVAETPGNTETLGNTDSPDEGAAIKVGDVSFVAKSGTFAGVKLPWREARISMDKVLAGLIDSYGPMALYGFGGSMGGSGLASLISSYPEKFTAAMPVAWNPRMARAESMAKVPFRTVVGTNDNIIDTSKVADFVAEIKALGGEVIFESVKGWGHGQTCILSYTDERLDWIFSRGLSIEGL